MKLIRFGTPGREQPGVEMDDGSRVSLSEHLNDYTPDFFAAGGMARVKELVQQHGASLPKVDSGVRLGPPVARPHKFIAIGLNYRKHAEEVGAKIPTEPEVFTKHTSSISGPNDDVTVPRNSTKLDYEIELAFVVQHRAKYLADESQAMQHVAGFTICNDVSERNFQTERGSQWTKGKSHDTFGPLGPWLVTPDEVGDPHQLDLKLTVNGEVRQQSNTNDLIFGVPHIVWYLSQYITLEPGDVVTTGTPFGVAQGMRPQKWLNAGETMELTIAKLGKQVQKVVPAR